MSICFLSGDLCRISASYKARIYIDHRENGAGLQHGIKGRPAASAQTIARGNRQSYNRGFYQSRHNRRQCPFPSGCHHEGINICHLLQAGKEPVNACHSYVVLRDDVAAHLLRHHARLLSYRHVGSACCQDAHPSPFGLRFCGSDDHRPGSKVVLQLTALGQLCGLEELQLLSRDASDDHIAGCLQVSQGDGHEIGFILSFRENGFRYADAFRPADV